VTKVVGQASKRSTRPMRLVDDVLWHGRALRWSGTYARCEEDGPASSAVVFSLRVAPYRRPPHFEIECAHHALALSRLSHRDPTQLYREPARSIRGISVPRVSPGPALRPIREPDGRPAHWGSGLAGPSSAVTLHGETKRADVAVAETVRRSVNFVTRVDAVLRRGRSSCAGRLRAATHHA